MKTTPQFIALLLLAIATPAWAEGPILDWVQQYGSSEIERGYAVASDRYGGYYVTGSTDGPLDGNSVAGGDDIFLTKHDAVGNTLWTIVSGTSSDDWGLDVASDGNDGIFVTGYTSGYHGGQPSLGTHTPFLSKYDTAGNTLWTTMFGTSHYGEGRSIICDGFGGVYVLGHTSGKFEGCVNNGYLDAFLTKFDSNGDQLWTRMLGTEANDNAHGMAADSKGGIYITGMTPRDLDGIDNNGNSDAFLAKYDSDGNKLWTKLVGSSHSEIGLDVTTNGKGGICVVGGYSNNITFFDGFVAMLDNNGDILWENHLATSAREMCQGVTTDGVGGVYVTGETRGDLNGVENAGSNDAFIVKYDQAGQEVWTELLGSGESEYGRDILFDGAGGVIVTGWTSGGLSKPADWQNVDFFLAKYTDPTFVPEPSSMLLLCLGAFALLGVRRRKGN